MGDEPIDVDELDETGEMSSGKKKKPVKVKSAMPMMYLTPKDAQ